MFTSAMMNLKPSTMTIDTQRTCKRKLRCMKTSVRYSVRRNLNQQPLTHQRPRISPFITKLSRALLLIIALLWVITLWITFVEASNTTYPSILYTTSKDIRIANTLKLTRINIIVKDLIEGSAIDFYYKGSLICWADHGQEAIQCVNYNGTHASNKTAILNTGIVTPDGLACDWLTKKLYWTDGDTNRIEVATLDGKLRKVLYWEDIDQLRAIALVPMEGIMFWTDWGEVPKIERAGMNGDLSTRKVIVSENIFWPNGLTIDFNNKQIYWVDGKLGFIDIMDYDGRNRKTILEKGIPYPFGIALFQDKLYWTDWKTWSIHVVDRRGGASRELIHSSYVPMDIRVLNSARQPDKPTPCDKGNGGCSDLCLLSPVSPGYSCACPTGIKLVDHHNCADSVYEVLFLVQKTEICQISLDSPDHPIMAVPLTDLAHAIAIDYDPVEGHIYWTDDEVKMIQRAKMNGSDQEVVISNEIYHPDGIAIDWIARNMYWTDTGTDRIEVSRLNGKHRRVIITNDLSEPRGIAVAPELGWLFWSDWYDKRPKIERSNLDGSGRIILLKDDLGWPNGITLDTKSKHLFFCDAKTDRIEVVNMNGDKRRELVNDNLPHVFGLTQLGDYLYWTDWQRRTIDRVNKNNGYDRKIIVDQLPNLMGVKAVSLKEPLNSNACGDNNGNCSQFCFYHPRGDFSCACEIGYELKEDGKTCVLSETFLIFSRFEHIGILSIENNHYSDFVPINGLKEASAIDIDVKHKRVYWADVKLRTINRIFLNGSMPERVVSFGLQTPEGLAVDWIAGNLYWCDSGTKRIEVSKLDGTMRKVLLWNDIKNPKNLLLIPKKGYMYWSEYDGITGSILKASMTGEGKHYLVNKIGRVISITLDYDSDLIYWITLTPNGGFIESIDLAGRRQNKIISAPFGFPSSLTYFKGCLFWLDWANGTYFQVNIHNGAIVKQSKIHLDHVTDLITYDKSTQTGKNPCAVNNGGCQQLCLVKGSFSSHGPISHHCSCETHFTLFKNNTCSAPNSFLIVAQKTTFYRVVMDIEDSSDSSLPIVGLKNVKAVEYDPISHMIYWIDGRTQMIKRCHENGSNSNTFVGNNGNTFNLYDLALDPYNRLLFWSCAATDTINITRLTNSSFQGSIFKSYDGEKPRNLALHPEKGFIYWTDLGSQHRVIRSRIDGHNRVIIASDLLSLEALAVDRVQNMVYFSYTSKVDVCDIHGYQRRTLISLDGAQIANIAIFGPYLYWIDKEKQVIERVNKTTGGVIEGSTVMNLTPQLVDIIPIYVLTPEALAIHPCSAMNKHGLCSHLCVVNAGNESMSNSYECSCPMGLVMSDHQCMNVSVCGPEHFICSSLTSECVPLVWRCDGQMDCKDGSDELNCLECNKHQFKCSDGHCIDKKWVCDGTKQCVDGSDESRCCELGTLSNDKFQCVSSGLCIPVKEVCDGWKHCTDGSDESFLACSLTRNMVHTMVVTNDKPYKGTMFFTIIFFATIFSMLLVIVYRCAKSDPDGTVSMASNNNMVSYTAIPAPRQYSSISNYTAMQNGTHVNLISPSNCSPLNPPPSPTTTVTMQTNDYIRSNQYLLYDDRYEPPCPTLCSQNDIPTDIYDDLDFAMPIEPCPPPPTPRSHSPSSSTYFSPNAPPPSPNISLRHC